ncbi:histidine phosphatase family protein [Enterococcus sp. LJL128]|uniref:histidine phosphatase family protein n=1 Tax=Enterococcus sp. LJL51 TaxID=3416656 RepID=UPI003CE8F6C7
MTTFYFVRHGKTELNIADSFQGSGADSPLLQEGIEQAGKLGKHLAGIAFDQVVVSTQKRAMDTANYILTENHHLNGMTLQYHDGLREIGFGEKEAMKVDFMNQQTKYLRERPDLYDPSGFGGETYDELVARGSAVISELEERHPEGKVLVVAHGVLLIVLINYLSGQEKRNWRKNGPLENTSLTILHKEGKHYTVDTFNDISYQ